MDLNKLKYAISLDKIPKLCYNISINKTNKKYF